MNITRAPQVWIFLMSMAFFSLYFIIMFSFSKFQSEHDGSDVHEELNVEHIHDVDIVPNTTKSPRAKYVTYYEDSESIPGKRTAVWELDKGKIGF